MNLFDKFGVKKRESYLSFCITKLYIIILLFIILLLFSACNNQNRNEFMHEALRITDSANPSDTNGRVMNLVFRIIFLL